MKSNININFDLKNIVDALDFIHSHFLELNSDYQDSINLSQFSDSIVISFSIKNKEAMIILFKNLKYVQVELIKKYRILMRGGIVIGDVIHNESLLLGPAMIDAYMLESKCAMSPRIVIDPKVMYEYYKAVKSLSAQGLFDKEVTTCKDLDDTYFIDYFNFYDVDFYLDGNTEEYFTSICQMISDNVNNSDMSIRVKYLWIRNKIKNSYFYKSDVMYKAIYKRIVTDKGKKTPNV